MNRRVLVALCMTLLAVSAAAQPAPLKRKFGATMDSFQTVPGRTVTSHDGATLIMDVFADGTAKYLLKSFAEQTFSLAGVTAHIHKGAAGVQGPIMFTLSGGPTDWSGTIFLTAPEQADLAAGLYYADVHTSANPGGELRGQLLPSPRVFGARLDKTQFVPPTSSSAKGSATFSLNPNNTLTYQVTTTGLIGGTTAHLHVAPFGVGAPVEITLSGAPPTWSGTTAALTDSQISALQTLGMYVDVHEMGPVIGSIRGQIVPSGIELFNSSDPFWASMLTMTVTGAPTDVADHGTFTLSITGGKPGGAGLMLVSLGADAALLSLQPLLIELPLLVSFVLPLNGAGAATLPVVTPSVPVSLNVALQYFGLDNTAANGKFNASNGLLITLQHF